MATTWRFSFARSARSRSTWISLRRAASGETARSLDEAHALLESSKSQLKLDFLLKNVPKALADSQAGIEHVSTIVRAMKSFAHADQDEKAPGDINRALADTLIVAQSEYKSVATVHTDYGELPALLCFQGRLNQVFLNLIVNAAHAIGETKRTDGLIRVMSRCDGVAVTVMIGDNGGGIPAKIQHQVFDPFFTTKPVGKGTGQGLSLARDIVAAHGGSLSFETRPGEGTDFIGSSAAVQRELSAHGVEPRGRELGCGGDFQEVARSEHRGEPVGARGREP